MRLIDKDVVLEKARAVSGDVFAAPLIIELIEKAPEVKRSEGRCINCSRNGSQECPFDKRVLSFRDDEIFFCGLWKR